MGRDGIRERHGWGIFPLILMAFLVVLYVSQSMRAVTRLRSDPPPEFFEVRPEWSAERRQREEGIARAYWECVLTAVQWNYSLASSLPSDPPPEFSVEERDHKRANNAANRATRLRYWRKLQQVWSMHETWEKSYEWDPYRIFRSGKS